jgi:hypothetical protein
MGWSRDDRRRLRGGRSYQTGLPELQWFPPVALLGPAVNRIICHKARLISPNEVLLEVMDVLADARRSSNHWHNPFREAIRGLRHDFRQSLRRAPVGESRSSQENDF